MFFHHSLERPPFPFGRAADINIIIFQKIIGFPPDSLYKGDDDFKQTSLLINSTGLNEFIHHNGILTDSMRKTGRCSLLILLLIRVPLQETLMRGKRLMGCRSPRVVEAYFIHHIVNTI